MASAVRGASIVRRHPTHTGGSWLLALARDRAGVPLAFVAGHENHNIVEARALVESFGN